ncbi:MAG: 50S ribosomal protein L32 [bacterium]
MAPLPKRKHSKSRSRTRRAHDALVVPNVVECPNCNAYKKTHHVCPECGVYKGRNIITPKAKKETS